MDTAWYVYLHAQSIQGRELSGHRLATLNRGACADLLFIVVQSHHIII